MQTCLYKLIKVKSLKQNLYCSLLSLDIIFDITSQQKLWENYSYTLLLLKIKIMKKF